MIAVTDIAKEKFLAAAQAEGRENLGLRVIVKYGGTYRPEFALNFVTPDEEGADDQSVDVGGFRVVMDVESAKWLKGASIDYIDGLDESGFKIDAPLARIEPPGGTTPKAPDGPVAAAVNRVLQEKVNPAVAAHGGNVSLVAIEDGTAYLRFGGGCQGCGMIDVTLKQGVERAIVEDVPEITRVLDVTDHAAGMNPYYAPAD